MRYIQKENYDPSERRKGEGKMSRRKKEPRLKTLGQLKQHDEKLRVREQEIILEHVSRASQEQLLEEVLQHITDCLKKRDKLTGKRSRRWLEKTAEFWQDLVQRILGYMPLLEYQALGSVEKLSKEAKKQRELIPINLVPESALALDVVMLGSEGKLLTRKYPQAKSPSVKKMIEEIRTGVFR